MKSTVIVLASLCILGVHPSLAAGAEAPSGGQSPLAIPTFHCLGLYWSPPGGAPDRKVLVRYRRQGASEWKEGLPNRDFGHIAPGKAMRKATLSSPWTLLFSSALVGASSCLAPAGFARGAEAKRPNILLPLGQMRSASSESGDHFWPFVERDCMASRPRMARQVVSTFETPKVFPEAV